MTGRIPDETLRSIRERVSLVEVVANYVRLKKTGRNHSGLCPFHAEKTPSFTVNEERGFFHCFGCGVGGDVFSFLMRAERLEFPEAVEQLARRAGVDLPKRTDANGPGDDLRRQLCEVNGLAVGFFHDVLAGAGGADARSYLAGRGLKPQVAERYGVGFAPSSGNALAGWLSRRGVGVDLAVKAGLLGRRDDGRVFDRFRGRVMFPIRDRRARVIAFGGRTLGNDQPKYLNSPESPVFRKGEGLYGLAEARDAIRAQNRVVLVEGYLDVLMLVQEGIPYAVGILGTALTAAQLGLLRPLGGDELTVYFFFDGDTAGQRAAERAFSVAAEAEVWGRAVFLPDGFDPDSFVRQRGLAETLAHIEAAVPLIDFYLDRVAPAGASLSQRSRAAEDFARLLANVRSPVRFELLAGRAAARLGVSEGFFRGAGRSGPGPATPVAEAHPQPERERPSAELLLLEVLATDPKVALWVEEQGVVGDFADPELAAAAGQLIDSARTGRGLHDLLRELPEAIASRLSRAQMHAGPNAEADRMKIASDCVNNVRQRARQRERLAMIAELRAAERGGDEEHRRRKLAHLNETRRREGGAP